MGKYYWLLILSIPLLVAASPAGCAHGLDVRIYYSKPDLGGLYRKQNDELVPYEKTLGFRCLNPSDWEAVLNYVKACQSK